MYVQFQKLVDEMETFPHLATSSPIFKCSKSEVNATWDTIAQTLNAMGPPERPMLECFRLGQTLKGEQRRNKILRKKTEVS